MNFMDEFGRSDRIITSTGYSIELRKIAVLIYNHLAIKIIDFVTKNFLSEKRLYDD